MIRVWQNLWPFLGGVLALLSFHFVGEYYTSSHLLDLGMLTIPNGRYSIFLVFWVVLGTLAASMMAVGFSRLMNQKDVIDRLQWRWTAGPDWLWIFVGMLFSFGIPAFIHLFILEGAGLTDDETAYFYQAQLLLKGTLSAPSHPLKIFFDTQFMINDGQFYSQYFLGWPAMWAIGILLGIPGLINPVYAALTLPALFFILRRLTTSAWARVGILLYLAAPMLMIGAGTGMSHSSCTFALAWTIWFVYRSRDDDAPWWSFSGAAICFSVAFFTRPTSTLSIGIPLLIWCLAGVLRPMRTKRLQSILAFCIPALAMAGSFFMINLLQNGSVLTTAYARYNSYIIQNNYRFTGYSPRIAEFLRIQLDPFRAMANASIGFIRFNFAFFGWPSSLLLIFFAGFCRRTAVLWGMVFFYFLVHCWFNSTGIDSFGPVHYYELGLPVILLSVFGIRRVHNALYAMPAGAHRFLPVGMLIGLLLVGISGYLPVRLGTLHRVSRNIRVPYEAIERHHITNAVVFVAGPFIQKKCIRPTTHHRNFRPNNDPDLKNLVLWVNHLGMEKDRRLMQYFPDRTGYLMRWTEKCKVVLIPLDEAAAPNG